MPDLPFQRALAAGTRSANGLPGATYWQQEASYRLSAELFPEERRLTGRSEIDYTNNSPDTLRFVYLELTLNLHAEGAVRNEPAEVTGGVTVNGVMAGGETLEEGQRTGAYYEVNGTNLVIVPPAPIPPGGTADFAVDFGYAIPQAGASGRMGYSEDNLFFLAYWYPRMGVYDDVVGWQNDQFLGRAELYQGFADYDIEITAPAQWLVLSTGDLLNAEDLLAPEVFARYQEALGSDTPVTVVTEADFGNITTAGETLTWRFRAKDVRDAAFSATRASLWDAGRASVGGDLDGDGETDHTLINALYRPFASRWTKVAEYGQHSITFLSEYTAMPYPWPHMTIIEARDIIGGGMEFPMMTIIGDYTSRSDSDLYAVTNHELAHMWVPMIVGTDERRYSWMDEGATTFHENQAKFDYLPGEDWNAVDKNIYLRVAQLGLEGEMMRRSNFHNTGTAFGIASYMKPATVLVALRGVLGEETFITAWQTFLREWAYKHPYPWDMFNTFESVSGRDLDWFWTSWYYGTGQLDQKVAGVRYENGAAEIVVENLGSVVMPVDLTVTLGNGATITERIPEDAWLSGARTATLRVEAGPAVMSVEIDAAGQYPDIDRSNNVWSR